MDQMNKELFDACASGDFASVCSNIAKGADVNVANGDGRTPLMRAAKRGYTDIVRVLLDNGSDVRKRDKNNKTALMGASKKGHLDIVKLLIESHADVNAHDNSGRTSLMRAAFLGYDEVVKVLIQAKADVNAQDNKGRTALMEAVLSLKLPNCSRNSLNVFVKDAFSSSILLIKNIAGILRFLTS